MQTSSLSGSKKRLRKRRPPHGRPPIERVSCYIFYHARHVCSKLTTSKELVQDASKAGIKYMPLRPLGDTSGKDWVFQPHPKLYKILSTNVFQHYTSYKNNNIDKTYILRYFCVGGSGTGKSRCAAEFASSIQEAIK